MFFTNESVLSHDKLFPLGELSAALAAAETGHVEEVVVGTAHPVVLLQLHVALDAARHLPLGLRAEQSAHTHTHTHTHTRTAPHTPHRTKNTAPHHTHHINHTAPHTNIVPHQTHTHIQKVIIRSIDIWCKTIIFIYGTLP